MLDAPDHGGLRSFPRPQNLPDMPNGWLQIRPEQYEGLGARRKIQVAEAVCSFLAKHAAAQALHMDRDELQAFAIDCVKESLSFGVKSEASHCRWAYLQLLAAGSF